MRTRNSILQLYAHKKLRETLHKLVLLQKLRNEQQLLKICSAMLLRQQLRPNKKRKQRQWRRRYTMVRFME